MDARPSLITRAKQLAHQSFFFNYSLISYLRWRIPVVHHPSQVLTTFQLPFCDQRNRKIYAVFTSFFHIKHTRPFSGQIVSSWTRPRQTTIQVRRQVIRLSTLLSTIPVATLNPATMELLSLFRGDTVICRYVWPDFTL